MLWAFNGNPPNWSLKYEENLNTVNGLIFFWYQFSWFLWRVQSTNSTIHETVNFCMSYEGNIMATKVKPQKWVIFFRSTKAGTNGQEIIHNNICYQWKDQHLRLVLRTGTLMLFSYFQKYHGQMYSVKTEINDKTDSNTCFLPTFTPVYEVKLSPLHVS